MNLRDPASSLKGSAGKPPGSSGPRRKYPRAAKGPRGPRSREPRSGADAAYLGEPLPEAPGKAPFPPLLFLLGEVTGR